MQELIKIKQLPVIEEQLKTVGEEIDKKVEKMKNLLCTEETVKAVKEFRAELNREFKGYEEQRKQVKNAIMKPYKDFEEIYKTYISDKFKNADNEGKNKINAVENDLKTKKEQEIREYFEEYKKANNIDFVTYEQVNINVTLSASMKSLKEQAKNFIDKIVEDLKLIETQENKTEILIEFKQSLNVGNAIQTVVDRHKALEKEKERQELEKELIDFAMDTGEGADIHVKSQEILQAPIEEKKEEILTLKFTVKATRTKLKALKEFLENGGYDYE